MASYDYRSTEELSLQFRFAVEGVEHRETWESLNWTNVDVDSTEFLGLPISQSRPSKPRLFISHKSKDTPLALKVVSWCKARGLDYWLDVLDPNLRAASRLTGATYASAIAAIIEMALLNCTHVLVLYTDDAAESRWVPYEYGRVKIPKVRSLQAAAWDMTNLTNLPEYLHLGKLCPTETSAKQWVNQI